ncbi:MAG: Rossmann-like and DUF2520 domain-containing protein [Acidobacteriota bacterium]
MRQSKNRSRGQVRPKPNQTTPKKPTHSVSIIGAGRMGTALGLALKAAGYQIEIVVTQRPARASRAARAVGAGTPGLSARQLSRLSPSQMDRLSNSSLILIATPDDAIAMVAGQLAEIFKSMEKPRTGSRIAIHTSGALSSEALQPLKSAGFATASMHPLISISEPLSDTRAFEGAFFTLEGDPGALRLAKSMVLDFGGHSLIIQARHKSLYHAAAVMASPHMVALFDIAVEMLGRCGVPSRRARQMLLPLMESTLRNLSTQEPARALTGTFKRGDVSTVRRHLAAIRSEGLSEALAAYRLLGKRSIGLARKTGMKPAEMAEIEKLIENLARLKVSAS